MAALKWDQEEIFFEGDTFFARLLLELNLAQISIDMEFYIFSEGVLASRIVDALKRKSLQGVPCRLLLDGFGTLLNRRHQQELSEAGVQVRLYHPVPSVPNFIFRMWRSLVEMNHRNHRKTTVIDGEIACLGGMNVDDCHLAEVSGERAWRDTSVLVSGDGVSDMALAFQLAWENAKGSIFDVPKTNILPSHPLVRLNHIRRQRSLYRKELAFKIVHAEKCVWIANPYFSPPLSLLGALCIAARRGVDVKVMLPQVLDHGFMRFVNWIYFERMLKCGVRVFEYKTRVLHAKTTMIDDWVTVGSSNKNYRSLFYDLESDVVLTHPESIELMGKQFLIDLQNCDEILLATLKKRSVFWRMGEAFFYLWRKLF